MNIILELFLTFLKIGAFTYGGGYAMIPLIQREVCDNKKWLKDEDIFDIVAIAESTPGPVAINAATFVGYKVSGFPGALFSTLGVIIPSFVIISIISNILKEFQNLRAVQYAFMGIRAGVLALIIRALYTMYKATDKNPFSYFIMGVSLIMTAFAEIDAIYVIIGCALFGLIYTFFIVKETKDDPA
ncbi:MAG: chromate transporter [Lachnospiraceae bacterium]|nr:chromate transporter [Lachnospiraceae bacterium]